MDVMHELAQPMSQSRPAQRERYTQQLHKKTTSYEGLSMVLRPSRPFMVGQRSAHFDTLFAFYIDLVGDPSRARQKDPDIQNRMRQDLQVLACLQVRKLATIQLRREWLAADDTPEAKIVASKFEAWFDNQYRTTEALNNLLDAILDGISIQEIVWDIMEEDYSFGIQRLFPCFKDRFVFSKDGKLALLTRRNVFYGDLTHPWQFIKHVYNPSGGAWAQPEDEGRLYWGKGLEDNIFPNYYFKTIVLNLYTRWLQRLASGVLIGRYPEKNPQGRAITQELLQAYQEDEELAFPSGEEWDIEITEATRAPADTFLSFIEYMDRQISKAFLGSTLIMDQGDVGSQSLGEVHERTTFGRVTEFDRAGLIETINTELVPVMGHINQIPKVLWPKFDMPLDETSPASLQILEAFQLLQGLGYDISMEMVSEKTGFRQPKPGERVLNMPMPVLGPEGEEGGGFGAPGMEEQMGPGAPMDQFRLSTPEGIDRFKSIIYRSAQNGNSSNGRRGQDRRFKYQLAVGGLDVAHKHTALLDKSGTGATTPGPDGHKHEIRKFRCRPSNQHTHDVMVTNADVDRIVRCLVEG